MASKFSILFSILFLICCFTVSYSLDIENNDDLYTSVEEKIESKFGEYTNYITNWLKSVNDKNLIKSDVGRMLHYRELEPKVKKAGYNIEGRNMKKMGSLIPLIFHLGMTASWMLLTTLLTAKSVAIGLTLLALKIAVGSAKVASYFTALKHKQPHYEFVPHHEYHGHRHKRSLGSIESHLTHHHQPEWLGYAPEYSAPHEAYSAPHEAYSSPHEASPYHAQAYEYEHPAEAKKAQNKFG